MVLVLIPTERHKLLFYNLFRKTYCDHSITHIFYKQLTFLVSTQITYFFMNK